VVSTNIPVTLEDNLLITKKAYMVCWCGKIIDNNRQNKLHFTSGCRAVIKFLFKKK